jgi:hypothetical protein
MALLSWTVEGRAVKLAIKRQLNVNPSKLGFDLATSRARILAWWCVYIVDIWDAVRRGRPPSIHEGEYDVPLPTIIDRSSDEEMFFFRLVSLTRILSRVLSFAYNNCQTSAISSIDASTEETVRNFRSQLADWYRAERLPRTILYQNLQVAYYTVVILLHRPFFPTPLATAFSDPIVLLVGKCASTIVRIAQYASLKDAGNVPWRLYVPAVGYLTAGTTLAQNAAWSVHIPASSGLRFAALRDINTLLDIFDQAELMKHHTSGMSGLLRQIFQRSEVDLAITSNMVLPDILGTPLPMPHEDPAASLLPEKAMSEKRPSIPLQPIAPGLMAAPPSLSHSDPTYHKRKHSQMNHPNKPLPQPLPPLAALDVGRRSPTARSVHSLSTYSSHSSGSIARHTLYPPASLHTPSTAYHPSYSAPPETPLNRPSRQWEPARPMSPPHRSPYDRRYPDGQAYPSPNPYYPDRRDEYYPRSGSPSHRHEPSLPYSRPPDSSFKRVPPLPLDPRHRNPTPPLSAAASSSPSWPAGYPYALQQQQRFEQPTSPRTINQNRWPDYYGNNYPQQRN